MAGRGGGGRDKVGASREGVEGGAWPATRARAGERPCWTARTSASWGGGVRRASWRCAACGVSAPPLRLQGQGRALPCR